jgi:acetyl-CoA carboxylase biotin carboxyl carrier protein
MMNVDVIKQILELMREHELAEFELEQDGLKVRVRKQGNTPVFTMPAPALPAMSVVPGPAPALAAAGATPAASTASAAAAASSIEAISDEESMELAVITSPIVGTFYRSPDPSSPPFVDVGQTIQKGQTLCIIEAMKLMNEIESEYEGQVVKVYVENGQPVQYGERMFAIKRS